MAEKKLGVENFIKSVLKKKNYIFESADARDLGLMTLFEKNVTF